MVRHPALRRLHRLSATVLAAFLLLHLANHMMGLFGQEQHIRIMAAIRPLYRNPVIEPLLLALLLVQIGSGLRLIAKGWGARRGWIAWTQALSGLYLSAFLLNHVVSVLAGRAAGLDTDFRFAAAGMHVWPFPLFFAPYYALAVAALFTHVGCALYWTWTDRRPRAARSALVGMGVLGAVLGVLIVGALAGWLFPVTIGPAYLATYRG